jgi:L-alanine-DL-glutamate epimerase-like enolase superfamily enzyme
MVVGVADQPRGTPQFPEPHPVNLREIRGNHGDQRAARELQNSRPRGTAVGYTHHKVAENNHTTIYERTDQGLFGLGILATGKDYVAVDNHTGAAVSGRTVGEARANLEQLDRHN